jgi:hypothetical protein
MDLGGSVGRKSFTLKATGHLVDVEIRYPLEVVADLGCVSIWAEVLWRPGPTAGSVIVDLVEEINTVLARFLVVTHAKTLWLPVFGPGGAHEDGSVYQYGFEHLKGVEVAVVLRVIPAALEDKLRGLLARLGAKELSRRLARLSAKVRDIVADINSR